MPGLLSPWPSRSKKNNQRKEGIATNKNKSRYFQTASKMDDALVHLLETREFEYITVKDICKEAGVNRSTFYLHYDNTYDLLQEVIQKMNDSFVSALDKGEDIESMIKDGNLKDLYLVDEKHLLPYLEFIKSNKKVYKAIKSNPSLFKAEQVYMSMFQGIFSPIMARFGLDEKYHKYLMDFYVNGISSFILDWVNDDCRIDTNELSRFIIGLVVRSNG